MPRMDIEHVKLVRDSILKDIAEGKPIENCSTLTGLIETILDMQKENETKFNKELNELKQRIRHERNYLENWKKECIEIAIDALTEATHRWRDHECKKLLKHLRNMSALNFNMDDADGSLPF